jgi:N-acyl-L-homoserine lactone synthetase
MITHTTMCHHLHHSAEKILHKSYKSIKISSRLVPLACTLVPLVFKQTLEDVGRPCRKIITENARFQSLRKKVNGDAAAHAEIFIQLALQWNRYLLANTLQRVITIDNLSYDGRRLGVSG